MAEPRNKGGYDKSWTDAFDALCEPNAEPSIRFTCPSNSAARRLRWQFYAFRTAMLHEDRYTREFLMSLRFQVRKTKLIITRRKKQ